METELSTYKDIRENCSSTVFRLEELLSLYKAMIRSLNREDVINSITDKRLANEESKMIKLSGSFTIVMNSQQVIQEMSFVHSWSIFDSWLQDTVETWLSLRPDLIPTANRKIPADKLVKVEDLAAFRKALVKELMSELEWKGPIKQLSKAKQLFQIELFGGDSETWKWFKLARDYRNQIVHSNSWELLRETKLGLSHTFNPNLTIIKCISRQIRVIETFASGIELEMKISR